MPLRDLQNSNLGSLEARKAQRGFSMGTNQGHFWNSFFTSNCSRIDTKRVKKSHYTNFEKYWCANFMLKKVDPSKLKDEGSRAQGS